ncbi:helix-turn-helix domain-containing protein [Deinococcus sp.]|uniref:helix-turn-helix domain-containing protein n=1 Tax=Deinococcus sp. TaxID=47478 RepID=UPI0039192E80
MRNKIREVRTAQGWSQADLAHRLSISRQTVNNFETGRNDPSLLLAFRISWLLELPLEEIFMVTPEERIGLVGGTWEYQDRLATAFNELSVLEQMGTEGWELISFGPLVLNFRRPEDPSMRVRWYYQRRQGLLTEKLRQETEREGWVYAGSWAGTYHYFKRLV